MLGFVIALLLFALAFALGSALFARFRVRFSSAAQALVFSAALGAAVLSYAVFALALTGFLYPVAALLLLACVALAAWRFAPRMLELPKPKMPETLFGKALAALLIAFVAVQFAVSLAPPAQNIDAQALSYHVAMPKAFIQAHGVYYRPDVIHSNWVMVTEWLYALGMLFDESSPRAIALFLNCLLLVGLYAFSRRWLSRDHALAAPALFASSQMVAAYFAAAHVDLPLAFFALLAVWAFTEWFSTRSATRSGAWLVVAGVFAGLAASVKSNGFVCGALLLAALVFVLLRERETLARAAKKILVFCLPCGAVAAPWYLKTLLYTGNPLFPFALPFPLPFASGGGYWDELHAEYLARILGQHGVPRTLENFLLAPWSVFTRIDLFGANGPLLLALVPCLLLYAFFGRERIPRFAVWLTAFCLAFGAAWFFMVQETRYLFPALALACIPAAYALSRFQGNAGKLVKAAVVIVIALNVAFISYHRFALDGIAPVALGFQSKANYLRAHQNNYAAFEWANAHLPQNARVLLFNDIQGLYLNREYVWGDAYYQAYVNYSAFETPDALAARLREIGVTHVFVNDAYSYESPVVGFEDARPRALMDGFLSERAEKVFDGGGTALYAIKKQLERV